MDPDSRTSRWRKIDRTRDAETRATLAEARGQRVPPTTHAYLEVARDRGPRGVVEALIARHNRRWDNVRGNLPSLGVSAAETLHVLFPIDVALWRFGVRFAAFPSDYSGEWPEHIRWAADSACQVSRLALAGNVVGAASVARTQLERWSENRSFNWAFPHPKGASSYEYYTELWSGAGLSPQSAGAAWEELSEVLHGRGPLIAATRWEIVELASPTGIGAMQRAVTTNQTAAQLALHQVRRCVAELAHRNGWSRAFSERLLVLPPALPSDVTLVEDAVLAVWPLTADSVARFGRSIERWGTNYVADVKQLAGGDSPRQLGYATRALEAFMSRRGRAGSCAAEAFAKEARHFGDDFDLDGLRDREGRYVLTCEIAGLLAGWVDGPVADALVTAASSLRGGFWLWLEDDDRAMVLVRSILEQTARLRTWRCKPLKARGLEERGDLTRSRDWLAAAGWRRLSILNRSLGEFGHARSSSHWTGARAALATLHPEAGRAEPVRIELARGNTLNQAARVLCMEVVATARQLVPDLGNVLASVMAMGNDEEVRAAVDNWLQHCWDNRHLSLGTPDLIAPRNGPNTVRDSVH